MKNKMIITAQHGRPSTKMMYSMMKSDGILYQRRCIKNDIYYRTYLPNSRNKINIQDKKAKDYSKSYNIDAKNSIFVRWGTRENISTDEKTITYNRADAIKKATNKFVARMIFQSNNVPIPKLVLDLTQDINFPVIGRPHIHSKGKNTFVFDNMHDLVDHYNIENFYYSEFIDKEREFRVHVGHSKVLVLMEKIKPKNNNVAWNRAQNDTDPFENIRWNRADEENLKPVMVAGIQAVNALGLDMGAADVMLKDGKAYVLEVNTAPTLNTSPYTAKRWAMYMDWLFRKNTRRTHWDYMKFQKAKSLFWKNYQLLENE